MRKVSVTSGFQVCPQKNESGDRNLGKLNVVGPNPSYDLTSVKGFGYPNDAIVCEEVSPAANALSGETPIGINYGLDPFDDCDPVRKVSSFASGLNP